MSRYDVASCVLYFSSVSKFCHVFYCSVPDKGVLGPAPPAPATETLRAESRAVTCCPEDGRLMFGGCVVVVRE